MLLDGNVRGGGYDLAVHLMKPENERVEIIEIRGFMSDNLKDVFKESYAISKGTRCHKHLFSMSIDPPIGADIGDKDYIDAANRTEAKLKLNNQPRTIVRHWKRGDDGVMRGHAHVVWCRIDASKMKAIDLPFSKLKMRDVSRELHIEHNIPMPPGLINHEYRDPRNFTLEQWQHAKRNKKDFRQVQSDFMDAWAMSDNRASFSHALKERGYILAKGDRGFVAVDHKGKIYAARQYSGVRRVEDLNKKLGDTIGLPSIETAQRQAAELVTKRLIELRQEQAAESKLNRAIVRHQEKRANESHERQQNYMRERHARNKQQEDKQREARFRKGFFGLWDRFTGRRKKTLLLNQSELQTMRERHSKEMRDLRGKHLAKLKSRHEEARQERKIQFETMKELREDIKRLKEPPKIKQSQPRKRTRTEDRPRRRNRSRDGPSPER